MLSALIFRDQRSNLETRIRGSLLHTITGPVSRVKPQQYPQSNVQHDRPPIFHRQEGLLKRSRTSKHRYYRVSKPLTILHTNLSSPISRVIHPLSNSRISWNNQWFPLFILNPIRLQTEEDDSPDESIYDGWVCFGVPRTIIVRGPSKSFYYRHTSSLVSYTESESSKDVGKCADV